MMELVPLEEEAVEARMFCLFLCSVMTQKEGQESSWLNSDLGVLSSRMGAKKRWPGLILTCSCRWNSDQNIFTWC